MSSPPRTSGGTCWQGVHAAARMFFAEGFAETTIEAIGREAGVTKRTIYELIGDENAVFRAACAKMQVIGPKFAFDIRVNGSEHPVEEGPPTGDATQNVRLA